MVPNDKQNLKINQNDASLCKMVEQLRKSVEIGLRVLRMVHNGLKWTKMVQCLVEIIQNNTKQLKEVKNE